MKLDPFVRSVYENGKTLAGLPYTLTERKYIS